MAPSKAKHTLLSQKGFTLIEALVAVIIMAVISASVIIFVDFWGSSATELSARQKLQQEGALITELFMRHVRNGSFVTVNTETEPPTQTTYAQEIRIRNADGAELSRFAIVNNELRHSIGGAAAEKVLTSYLAEFTDSSRFRAHVHGACADFEFVMDLAHIQGAQTYRFTRIIERIRCKN